MHIHSIWIIFEANNEGRWNFQRFQVTCSTDFYGININKIIMRLFNVILQVQNIKGKFVYLDFLLLQALRQANSRDHWKYPVAKVSESMLTWSSLAVDTISCKTSSNIFHFLHDEQRCNKKRLIRFGSFQPWKAKSSVYIYSIMFCFQVKSLYHIKTFFIYFFV